MRRWTTLLAVITLLATASAALACPMCKDSVVNADGASGAGLSAGFNYSIYFMLSGFVGCLILVARTLIKGAR